MNIGKEKNKLVMISIKQKILIVCVVVIAFTILITSVISHQFVKNKTKQRMEMFDDMTLKASAAQLENFFDTIDLYYHQIIADSSVGDFVFGESNRDVWEAIFNKAQIQKSLLSHMGTVNYIHSIAVIRVDGSIVCSSNNYENFYSSQFENEWGHQLEEEKENSLLTPEYTFQTHSSEQVLTYIKKIYNIYDGQKEQGYVFITIRKNKISHMMESLRDNFDYFELKKEDTTYYQYMDAQHKDSIDRNQHVLKLENYPYTLHAYNGNLVLYGEFKYIRNLFLLIGILGTSFAAVVLVGVLSHIVKPIEPLLDCVEEIGKNNLDYKVHINSKDEFEVLGEYLNRMSDRLKLFSEKEKEHQLVEMNMEYGILMAQITPHFIYNALNSIKYLAGANQPEQIHKMVNSLIRLLQDSIRMGEEKVFTTIENELEITKYYCEIQQIMYPDCFELLIDIEECLLQMRAPKSILQPLVENAILHGIVPSGVFGQILIKGFVMEGRVVLKVCDTGVGIDAETWNRIIRSDSSNNMRHTGMANIRKRIQFIYAADAEFSIDKDETYATCITMVFPSALLSDRFSHFS